MSDVRGIQSHISSENYSSRPLVIGLLVKYCLYEGKKTLAVEGQCVVTISTIVLLQECTHTSSGVTIRL